MMVFVLHVLVIGAIAGNPASIRGASSGGRGDPDGRGSSHQGRGPPWRGPDDRKHQRQLQQTLQLTPARPAANTAMNPLKGLAELPKVHHSWPIPAQYINATAYDGIIVDYARVTGSLALEREPSSEILTAAVDVCGRATQASTSGR